MSTFSAKCCQHDHSRYLIHGERDAVNPEKKGTKMAAHYELEVEGGKEAIVKLRLTNSAIFSEKLSPFGEYFDIIFKDRIREADEFYDGLLHTNLSQQEVAISRQAYASEYSSILHTGNNAAIQSLLLASLD